MKGIMKYAYKKIIEYVYNYAEYIVTDGKYDINCICDSVPLPND